MSLLQLTRWTQVALAPGNASLLQRAQAAGPALAALLPTIPGACATAARNLASGNMRGFLSGMLDLKNILEGGQPDVVVHIDGALRRNAALVQRLIQDCLEGETRPARPEITSYMIRNRQAENLRRSGLNAPALPLFEAALQSAIDNAGREHPYVATIFHNLAETHYGLGNLAEAESHYLRALAIHRKTRGVAHEQTIATCNNLADLYVTQGRSAAALNLFNQNIAAAEGLGQDHPHLAALLNNRASLHSANGDHGRAEFDARRAVVIHAAYGHTPDLGRAWANLANILASSGKPRPAQDFYNKAVRLLADTLGPNHPDTKDISRRRDEALANPAN
jgi:tetratricopeptide (TPR) repeat protein